VTDALYARLTEDDRATVEAALEGGCAALWAQEPDCVRRRLALHFAAFYGLEGPLRSTGLSAVMPPEDVHAMARGPLAAGGDFATADLVVASLADAGTPLATGARVLDFGSSSGRVIRALAAGRPDLDCLACDPNTDAIAWAQRQLPMAQFFVSESAPPLSLTDGSLDAVFAISIWSHFDAPQALAWLTEMHRVIRPGGALLLTTHGQTSIAEFLRSGVISADTAALALDALIRRGHFFIDTWKDRPEGDWGVKSSGWGTAYLSTEWLLVHTTPAWAVRRFVPGGLQSNQDVTILQRCEGPGH
jgi:SAM-dependent methyltransferase